MLQLKRKYLLLFCFEVKQSLQSDEIPDDAVVPVVMAAVNVDNVIEGELLKVTLPLLH